MSQSIAQLVDDLASKQVGFYAYHDNPFGQATVPLTSVEVAEYANDPVSYLARHYGVTRDAYLAWHSSNYNVLCAGFTKAGKPCKNIVPGLSLVADPKVWSDGQGRHCAHHI